MALREEGQAPCRHTVEALNAKLDDVRRQREQLGALERDLEALIVHVPPAAHGSGDRFEGVFT